MRVAELQKAVEIAPAMRKPRINSTPYSASTKVSVISNLITSSVCLVVVPRMVVYHLNGDGSLVATTPSRVTSQRPDRVGAVQCISGVAVVSSGKGAQRIEDFTNILHGSYFQVRNK